MDDGAVLQLISTGCIIILTKEYRLPVSRKESVSKIVVFHVLRNLTCMYLLARFYFSTTMPYPGVL